MPLNFDIVQGDALPTTEMLITQERIDKYAVASGDFNPIHVDSEFASTARFGGTVAHGMLVAATISDTMAKAFGIDWLERGSLKLRFRAPVYPGDVATGYGHVESAQEDQGSREFFCLVGVRKQDGQDVITGEARVRVWLPGSD